MADNQSSLNENLIAAGLNPSNPATTYVDFADSIAKNQQEQASQEQAIALAKQHVAQAQHQTKEEGQAEAAGYNSLLKDSMTPDEAVAYIKIALKAKGQLDDATQALIGEWSKTLPARVERQEVEAFLSRTSHENLKLGVPAQFDTTDKIKIPTGMTAEALGLVADKTDPTIGHVPEDGMYQVGIDAQGNVKRYVPGGKEPVDPSVKANEKTATQNRKDFGALDGKIDTAFKTRSGGLGSLVTAIYRSVRAINTLNSHSTLTAQDLANVSQDIAGIYQGGAPTVVSSKDNDYSTAITDLANVVRHYAGVVIDVNAPVRETKAKLLQVVDDLRDSSIENFRVWMVSHAAGYEEAIASNPDRWQRMQDDKIRAVESGLLLTAEEKGSTNITGSELSTPSKNPLKKAADAVSSVLKPTGLPSASDIDAELARRKKKG